jgi:hypothetical protein
VQQSSKRKTHNTEMPQDGVLQSQAYTNKILKPKWRLRRSFSCWHLNTPSTPWVSSATTNKELFRQNTSARSGWKGKHNIGWTKVRNQRTECHIMSIWMGAWRCNINILIQISQRRKKNEFLFTSWAEYQKSVLPYLPRWLCWYSGKGEGSVSCLYETYVYFERNNAQDKIYVPRQMKYFTHHC